MSKIRPERAPESKNVKIDESTYQDEWKLYNPFAKTIQRKSYGLITIKIEVSDLLKKKPKRGARTIFEKIFVSQSPRNDHEKVNSYAVRGDIGDGQKQKDEMVIT